MTLGDIVFLGMSFLAIAVLCVILGKDECNDEHDDEEEQWYYT